MEVHHLSCMRSERDIRETKNKNHIYIKIIITLFSRLKDISFQNERTKEVPRKTKQKKR